MGLLSCSVVTGPAFGPEANALQDAAMHHQISQWLHEAFNDNHHQQLPGQDIIDCM